MSPAKDSTNREPFHSLVYSEDVRFYTLDSIFITRVSGDDPNVRCENLSRERETTGFLFSRLCTTHRLLWATWGKSSNYLTGIPGPFCIDVVRRTEQERNKQTPGYLKTTHHLTGSRDVWLLCIPVYTLFKLFFLTVYLFFWESRDSCLYREFFVVVIKIYVCKPSAWLLKFFFWVLNFVRNILL